MPLQGVFGGTTSNPSVTESERDKKRRGDDGGKKIYLSIWGFLEEGGKVKKYGNFRVLSYILMEIHKEGKSFLQNKKKGERKIEPLKG